jgi:hypothetical protein
MLKAGDQRLGSAAQGTVILLRPGEIAFDDEILTEQLRWHLVSLLEERLRTCDSLWICHSPNYYTSWWTRMELILCKYRDEVGHYRNRTPIWRYDPGTGTVDSAEDLVPDLTYEQRRRLDRLLSNTGRSMGAETVQRSGKLGEQPGFRNMSFWNDRIFTPEFASVAWLDTGAVSGDRATVLTPADIDAILHSAEDRFVAVPQGTLALARQEGYARFQDFTVSHEKLPRYLWYATRMGKQTAPPGSIDNALTPLPVYRAQRIAQNR